MDKKKVIIEMDLDWAEWAQRSFLETSAWLHGYASNRGASSHIEGRSEIYQMSRMLKHAIHEAKKS